VLDHPGTLALIAEPAQPGREVTLTSL
jgi:hypothetical protein